ncbi:MAG: hypothetical protein ACRCZB_00755 [Bacteroidales bacterium]
MADNTNISLTVAAWANIVIRNWEDKMRKLNINSTYALARSFAYTVENNAGGDPARIEFAFNYYGRFVDMGVGGGQKLGETGRRRPKKWYSKPFFADVRKLGELMLAKYASKAQIAIVEPLSKQ